MKRFLVRAKWSLGSPKDLDWEYDFEIDAIMQYDRLQQVAGVESVRVFRITLEDVTHLLVKEQ